MLIPRQPTPALAVPTLSHGAFDLQADKPQAFTLVVFYRGLHCPICAKYLTELKQLLPQFEQRGVKVIAISSDAEERAEGMAKKIGGGEPAHRLRPEPGPFAREWGLYISTSRGKTSTGVEEPEHFSEPGLFLLRPDATLYFASTQTMPFARPHFDEVLSAIDFVLSKNYEARGEYTGAV